MRTVVLVAATSLLSAIGSAQSHALVDIGGRRLDVLRAGAGGPAVVFEVGLADSLDTWVPVCTAIAEFTTTIARSGHDIQNSEPQLVIDAIRFVLDRVRAK